MTYLPQWLILEADISIELEVDEMMKRIKMFTAICLAVILTMPLTAHAANAPATSVNALAGVNITILDTTTPATSHGRRGNNSYFIAADGRTLGVMSGDDARIVRERVAVTDAGGNWLPPGNWPSLTGLEWSKWFADEFNRLRGLGSGSGAAPTIREDAILVQAALTQEQERQELIRLINSERQARGMHRLVVCEELMDFAQIRAQEGGRAGERPHTRPNGDFVYNELWTGALTARVAFDAWMNSPPHRGPMLGDGRWNRVETFGVGVADGGAIIILGAIRTRPSS